MVIEQDVDHHGKRWTRRRDNGTAVSLPSSTLADPSTANFVHNPHIAHTTTVDVLPLQVPLPTFPHPLPNYLPRTLLLPPARPPPALPSNSSAGLFSLSLRGVRRTLRARPSAGPLVKAIESHLSTWLQGGTYLNPDQAKGRLRFPGEPVGGREDIREVGREATSLVWIVKPNADGGFERYVLHCVARWYGVVSFSKETDGHRLTYLLRPNITRPDPRVDPATTSLDTPPATDASDFHIDDASLSDDATTDTSDIDSATGDLPTGTSALSDIQESRSSSPAPWSALGGPDFGIDSEIDSDGGFAASMESLSLSANADPHDDLATSLAETTLTPSRPQNVSVQTGMDDEAEVQPPRARTNRDRLRTFYPRSASSPSPARRSPRRLPTRKLGARQRNDKKALAGAVGTDKGSFYDYLFA